MRTWHFTALDFRTLWEAAGRDVLPYPLHHRHTDVETQAEVLRLRSKAAENLMAEFDSDLDRAMAALLAPHARVEVAGAAVGSEMCIRDRRTGDLLCSIRIGD